MKKIKVEQRKNCKNKSKKTKTKTKTKQKQKTKNKKTKTKKKEKCKDLVHKELYKIYYKTSIIIYSIDTLDIVFGFKFFIDFII